MVFRGFWLVSIVFQGGFKVFHGFWLVSMVFHGFWLVSMVFMVPCWFFIFHVENTLKLYSGPTIPLGLAGRKPALAWSFKKISKRLKRLKALQSKHLPAIMWSLW